MDPVAFRKIHEGLPEWIEGNIATGCLVAADLNVVLATEDGHLFASVNAGSTWNELPRLPKANCLALIAQTPA